MELQDTPAVQEARERAGRIVQALDDLAALVQEAWDNRDDQTLGYESWQLYCAGQFGKGQRAVEARQVIVSMLRGEGLSQPAIAAEVGVNQSTVNRDLADSPPTYAHVHKSPEVIEGDSPSSPPAPAPEPVPVPPKTITGKDGRTQPADRGGMNGEERRQRRRVQPSAQPKGVPPVKGKAPKGDTAGATAEIRRRVRAGAPVRRGDIAERYGVSEMFVRQAMAVEEAEVSAPANGKPKNWNGKTSGQRQHALHAERRLATTEAHIRLVDAQLAFSRMCSVLETIQVQDYGLEDVDLWKVTDIYEDLISLGEWYTRQLSAVQGYLGQFPARERIEKLRNVTGRTPEEAATALHLADKLERTLENQLA